MAWIGKPHTTQRGTKAGQVRRVVIIQEESTGRQVSQIVVLPRGLSATEQRNRLDTKRAAMLTAFNQSTPPTDEAVIDLEVDEIRDAIRAADPDARAGIIARLKNVRA